MSELLYYSIWGLLFVFAFLEVIGLKKVQANSIFILCSVFLFVMSFIRWETGTDWDSYYSSFINTSFFFQPSNFEWGYARLCEFAKIIFNNYTGFLFCQALIIFSIQTKALRTLSVYPIFSLFFLWSIIFANVFFVRQTISTIILIYAVKFIRDKQLFHFIGAVTIACLFHVSAFVFFIAYFVYHAKFNIRMMIWGIIISIFISGLLSILISKFSMFLGHALQHKVELYLTMGKIGDTVGAGSSYLEILIRGLSNKLFVFLIFLFFYRYKFKTENDNANIFYKGMLNLYWFGLIIYFSTISLSVVFVRFSFPFDMMQIFLLPMVISCIKRLPNKVIFTLCFSLFLALRFYITLNAQYFDVYVPYKSILNL